MAEIMWLALTLLLFAVAQWVQRRTGWLLLNPILITIALLIIALRLTSTPYDTYAHAGRWVEFWLKPAIVALGLPLYRQLPAIRRQLWPILLSQIVGCLVGLFSVIGIAHWLGASREVVVSLAPKSVTTPIAMEITAMTGGIPSLTAAVVVVTGLLGALVGLQLLRLFRVHSPIAEGLAMGTASHAVGTSAATAQSERMGAYAGLGLTLNGLLTALLTPSLLQWV